MADVPEEGGFVSFGDIPSWKFIEWGAQSVLGVDDDPENTVFISLTARELALLVFAIVYTTNHIRELEEAAQGTLDKLREITEAQEFKPTTGGSHGND
jgi:hypothetical protein